MSDQFLNLLTEAFDSEPYSTTMVRKDGSINFEFVADNGQGYRVQYYPSNGMGPNVRRVYIGQKFGSMYKDVMTRFDDPMRIVATMLATFDEFSAMPQGRATDGYVIDATVKAFGPTLRLLRRIVARHPLFRTKFTLLDSQWTWDPKRAPIWIIRKGKAIEDVFNGKNVDVAALGGSVKAQDEEPVPAAASAPVAQAVPTETTAITVLSGPGWSYNSKNSTMTITKYVSNIPLDEEAVILGAKSCILEFKTQAHPVALTLKGGRYTGYFGGFPVVLDVTDGAHSEVQVHGHTMETTNNDLAQGINAVISVLNAIDHKKTTTAGVSYIANKAGDTFVTEDWGMVKLNGLKIFQTKVANAKPQLVPEYITNIPDAIDFQQGHMMPGQLSLNAAQLQQIKPDKFEDLKRVQFKADGVQYRGDSSGFQAATKAGPAGIMVDRSTKTFYIVCKGATVAKDSFTSFLDIHKIIVDMNKAPVDVGQGVKRYGWLVYSAVVDGDTTFFYVKKKTATQYTVSQEGGNEVTCNGSAAVEAHIKSVVEDDEDFSDLEPFDGPAYQDDDEEGEDIGLAAPEPVSNVYRPFVDKMKSTYDGQQIGEAYFQVYEVENYLTVEYEITGRRSTPLGIFEEYSQDVKRANAHLSDAFYAAERAGLRVEYKPLTKAEVERQTDQAEMNGGAYSEYEQSIGAYLKVFRPEGEMAPAAELDMGINVNDSGIEPPVETEGKSAIEKFRDDMYWEYNGIQNGSAVYEVGVVYDGGFYSGFSVSGVSTSEQALYDALETDIKAGNAIGREICKKALAAGLKMGGSTQFIQRSTRTGMKKEVWLTTTIQIQEK